MTIIEDITQIILETINTEPLWAEAQALSLLSTALGKDRKTHTQVGALPLNLFFLCIGPSGLGSKTTPMVYYTKKIIDRLSDNLNRQFTIPSRYTVEGMISYLASEEGAFAQGMMMRDEFSSVFKDTRHKDYLADGLEFLSELYDGTVQRRYTRTSQLEVARNVFVNVLGATTLYFFSGMDPGFFTQGTGNRFLYIISNPPRVNFTDPNEFFVRPREQLHQRYRMFDALADRLVLFNEQCPNFIWTQPDAANILARFRDDRLNIASRLYINDYKNVHYSYIARNLEHACKLANCFCS